MQKWIGTILIAAVAFGGTAIVAACGDDDDNPGGTPDSGTTDTGTTSSSGDTGTSSGSDTGTADTGADAGCNFAVYVTNLINTQTAADTIPTTNLGDNCVDKQDQAEFKPLFP